MRKSPLLARLAKLEAALTPRVFPKLSFTVYDRDDAVEGFRSPNGVEIARHPGEPLSDLLSRAWRHPGVGACLMAIYPPDPEPEYVGIALEPELEPVGPFALAGIGRVATKAELEQRGVIPVPAERLI